MNVDRRLHRAARELRGIDVTVPPIAPPARRGTRALLAVAASVLVFAGAASVVVPMALPGGPEPASGDAVEGTPTLHPLDEIALIEGLTVESEPRVDLPVRPAPPGVV